MRRFMNDSQIEYIISSTETKGIDLLNSRTSVGSLSESDEFTSAEMHRHLLYSQNIQESPITGCEGFPGEVLKPLSEDVVLSSEMLDRLVEYYVATYETLDFRKPFGEGPEDSIIINVKMNKYGRCRIGSEIFGSAMSSRHMKSSFILAKFITNDGNVDCYPGQVQYYFTHIVNLPDNRPTKHFLVYVRWYKHASSANIRYYFTAERTCNVELWSTEFYPEGRDCIIPIHHILGRFVPIKYKIPNRRNETEYLAINPINRKYHIR